VSVYNAGDPGSSRGLGRFSGEGNGNPLQYYCLEKSHGQRSLVGYSLWGCKESDTTERLHFTTLHFTTLHFTSLLVPERKGYDSQWQDSFTSGEGNYLNLHRNFNHIYCAFLVTFHNCFPLSQYPSFVFSWSWYLKYQLVPSGRILTFPFLGISHLYLGYRWQ